MVTIIVIITIIFTNDNLTILAVRSRRTIFITICIQNIRNIVVSNIWKNDDLTIPRLGSRQTTFSTNISQIHTNTYKYKIQTNNYIKIHTNDTLTIPLLRSRQTTFSTVVSLFPTCWTPQSTLNFQFSKKKYKKIFLLPAHRTS